MILFTIRFILIDFLFVSDIIKCIKLKDKSEFNAELMVAALRICNSACCVDKFVFLGVIDISDMFRDVWEPVPYGNVCFPL